MHQVVTKIHNLGGRVALSSAVIPLTEARTSRQYRVERVLRPSRGLRDSRWHNTKVRLSELGVFPGQVIEKTGSAGPGCPIILKVGGSRVAISSHLCSLILVRAV